ncbi:hypothetical protein M0804_008842 [Polistes exclamans]|nr:hypothetical protein M0804_008842 [Polistes exclamans]
MVTVVLVGRVVGSNEVSEEVKKARREKALFQQSQFHNCTLVGWWMVDGGGGGSVGRWEVGACHIEMKDENRLSMRSHCPRYTFPTGRIRR